MAVTSATPHSIRERLNKEGSFWDGDTYYCERTLAAAGKTNTNKDFSWIGQTAVYTTPRPDGGHDTVSPLHLPSAVQAY